MDFNKNDAVFMQVAVGYGSDKYFPGQQLGVQLLKTHGPAKCIGEICCIHNPTEHHMRSWPQNWRDDRGIMERVCSHGVGHPDPDDLMVRTREGFGIHGCDGCCQPPRVLVNA